MAAAEGLLDRVRLTANSWKRAGIPIGDSGGWHSAAELLARTELSLQQVGACLPAVGSGGCAVHGGIRGRGVSACPRFQWEALHARSGACDPPKAHLLTVRF